MHDRDTEQERLADAVARSLAAVRECRRKEQAGWAVAPFGGVGHGRVDRESGLLNKGHSK